MSAGAGERVARWIERAVIGLDLCPFASSAWRTRRVRLAVDEAASPEEAVQAVLREAVHLLETSPSILSTTLVVFPNTLSDFDTFLDATATAESALSEAGAEGILQLATFHPDYGFEDVPADALSNYTNRAPYPIMHLLREAELADAIDHHPDPEGIPARNVARMQALGREAIIALWDEISRG